MEKSFTLTTEQQANVDAALALSKEEHKDLAGIVMERALSEEESAVFDAELEDANQNDQSELETESCLIILTVGEEGSPATKEEIDAATAAFEKALDGDAPAAFTNQKVSAQVVHYNEHTLFQVLIDESHDTSGKGDLTTFFNSLQTEGKGKVAVLAVQWGIRILTIQLY